MTIKPAKPQFTLPVDQVSPGKLEEVKLAKELWSTKQFLPAPSTQPVVALDIDGVMADFNKAMKPYSLMADTDQDCPESYNFVEAGWFNNFDDFESAHIEVMEKAGDIQLCDHSAPSAVQKLIDNDFRVLAVTARREPWRKETVRFFKKNGINITSDRLFFMDKKNKSEMHFDYIIDDAPKNIIDTLQRSKAMPVVYHQPYNEHLPGMRARNLDEFATMIINHRKEVVG